MKECSVCKNKKNFDQFFFIRYNKNGSSLYRAKCNDCYNEHYKEKHRSKNELERKKVYQERKSKTTFISRKNDRLMRRFGISLNDFEIMIKNQNNSCYICQKKFTSQRNANVDHDHKTSKVRKLLCTPCNTTLGLLKENSDVFKSCIEYLKEHYD